MAKFSGSYVLKVLLATPRPASRIEGGSRGGRLRTYLFDPYRPELHYMHGLGPKCREKHERGVGNPSGGGLDRERSGPAAQSDL
jgi:hypothetical protein